jgi:hypothetical protein
MLALWGQVNNLDELPRAWDSIRGNRELVFRYVKLFTNYNNAEL